MSANPFPREASLAESVKQQEEEVGKEEVPKEEGGEGEKKGKSKKRRERRKNKKIEATTAAPTGITPPSPQLPTVTPTATQLPAPREDNQPILASAPVPPPSFIFGPITTTFGKSQPASLPLPLPLPPVNQPSPFVFGPVTTTFTQAPPPPPPPPPPHKTFTEDIRLTAAKAVAKAEAYGGIVALKKKLGESQEELDSTKEELAKARDEQKLKQEALDAAERQLGAINARLDKKRAELDSEQSARRSLEAELVVTREALVASDKKLSSGLTFLGRLPLLFLLLLLLALMVFFFWCIWASMQLPLAVVSRIDSAHMYPEEMSMAWMTMDEFGWFGD